MSDLDIAPQERTCGADAASVPVLEFVEGRDVVLGGPRGLPVTRTLPARGRRMVGAWCFLDAYGPVDLDGHPGMRVPPHPHTGLQTVTWLVDGEVLHRDSVGSEQVVRPGALNLMTAGRGISHSEESLPGGPSGLQGVQLWVAMPDAVRHAEPHFEHHDDLPWFDVGGGSVTILSGDMGGEHAPATAYSSHVGAQVELSPGARTSLPLRPDFEHAVLALRGVAAVDGARLPAGPLLYLGSRRDRLDLAAGAEGVLLMLIGGVPFDEEIVMWWNFVGRSHEEIVAFRQDWQAGEGFGEVLGYGGGPLAAPPLPGTRLKPRGRER